MKKHLLLFLAAVLSISAFAADLNSYAYNVNATYNPNTFVLHVEWNLNANAQDVKIVAENQGHDIVLKEYGPASATKRHAVDINVMDAVVKGLRTNEDISWRIDVYSEDRPGERGHQHISTKPWSFTFRSPFSVDIDNNPESPYFGQMYVTQLMWYDKDGSGSNDYYRGIYIYDQQRNRTGIYMGAGLEAATSHSWYGGTHGVPHMVRVMQDGTGRLLVSSSDRDQETHLWSVDPAKPSTWNTLITSNQMKSSAWTNHGAYASNVKMANISVDIRENGENYDVLLYFGTVNSSSINQSAGFCYSGIYRVPKSNTDLKNGTYIPLTAANPKTQDPHPIVTDEYTGSMFTANANFDKYGGVLYNSYKTGIEYGPEEPSLIHKTVDGNFKTNYTDGEFLKRKNVSSKGLRFNHNFSKVAIANGGEALDALGEVRFYDVTHENANEHLSLDNGTSVDIISGSTGAYVHDIAWDYASNVFVSVRNQGSMYGIYMIATDLNGVPTSTPGVNTFNIECPSGGPFTVTVNGQVDNGTINQNLGDCKLKIDGAAANWGSTRSKESCATITVKAEKDARHKFVGWYNGSTLITTDDECTIYVVGNTNLTAKFQFAEYSGLTWHNLLVNKNTDNIKGDLDNINELYELIKVHFNYYNVKYNKVTDSKIRSSQLIEDARVFFAYGVGQSYHVAGYIEGFVKGNNNYLAFKWLGDYINTVDKSQISSSMKDWYPYVPDFFIGSNGWSSYNSPSQWLPYYWEGICGLPKKMNYNDPMPTVIKEMQPTGATINADNSTNMSTVRSRTPYPTGYVVNTNATQLLAWREGSTSGPIVHNVYKDDMALYATYMNKHISDSQDNTDVIRLMQNPGYASTTHTVTVDRKLQAGMYNTICLPFSVNLNSLDSKHPLYGADVCKLTGKTEELYDSSGESVIVLNFETVTQMEAGKPYIIKLNGSENVKEPMTFEKVVYNDLTIDGVNEEVTENFSTVTFHAIMKPTEVPEGALILVAENRLAIATGGEMKGLRGYFVIDDPYLQEAAEDGRVYMSMNKPTTTSIPVAPEAEQQTKPKVRKIMRDGHIYILRGEEIYTITGHRVK